MWKNLFSEKLYNLITQQFDGVEITEFRLRQDKPIMVKIKNYWNFVLDSLYPNYYICTKFDVENVIYTASKNSVYSVSNKIAKGFINYEGGIRVGICGEGVMENNKLIAIKNINSVTIRLPHQIFGITNSFNSLLENFENTLIISPPSCGKTTLLREVCRVLSNNKNNVSLIDERGEISGCSAGVKYLDVGTCTDVLCYVDKNLAYENLIRAMAPEIIVTDEIFGQVEVDNILEAMRCGIKVCATIHSKNMESLKSYKIYDGLIENFTNFIVLSNNPKIGTIETIISKQVKEVCVC